MTEQDEVHKISLLVARLDERTKAMQEVLNNLVKSHSDLTNEFDDKYVTKDEFAVYKWVFTTVGAVSISYVVGRFMGLIS